MSFTVLQLTLTVRLVSRSSSTSARRDVGGSSVVDSVDRRTRNTDPLARRPSGPYRPAVPTARCRADRRARHRCVLVTSGGPGVVRGKITFKRPGRHTISSSVAIVCDGSQSRHRGHRRPTSRRPRDLTSDSMTAHHSNAVGVLRPLCVHRVEHLDRIAEARMNPLAFELGQQRRPRANRRQMRGILVANNVAALNSFRRTSRISPRNPSGIIVPPAPSRQGVIPASPGHARARSGWR